jgi:Bacterial type II/III secretion system short domain
MKRFVILAVLLSFVSAASLFAAETDRGNLVQKVFHFQYKPADKAASLVKPLVSAEGSVSIQPAANTLVVTDYPDRIVAIGNAIAKFDTAPRAFRLEIRLVAASHQAAPPAVPADLKEISAKLSGVLRFNAFEKIGEVTLDGKENDRIKTDIGRQYHAELNFGEYDPVSDSLRVSDFALGRMQSEKSGQEIAPVLKTSLNLKIGQTVVLGASRLPDSQKALMLIIVAKKTHP